MILSKIEHENKTPDWLMDNSSFKNLVLSSSETHTENVDEEHLEEDDIVEQCDCIEKCASAGDIYYYKSSWSKNQVSHLREYAIASGLAMDKFIEDSFLATASEKYIETEEDELDYEAESGLMVEASDENLTDQIDIMTSKLTKTWKDPFNIDERSDTSYMDKKNWQVVEAQSTLKDAPSFMDHAVLALRGGEDYNKSNDPKFASNQNTISNPNNIEKMKNSKKEDTGTMLKRLNDEKEEKKVANRKEWEQEKISGMKYNHIVPKGSVFPTESMVAQSGLNNPSSKQGVYASFNIDDVPEKTRGEQLKESNEERKSSIQRKANAETEWEKPSRQSSRSISDNFADELKKRLKK